MRRAFGDHVALAGVDLTIAGGEFVVLLGPSGCGKSTALRCLAGVLPLSGGRILLDGERIDHLSPAERGFGLVSQDHALPPHLSVRQHIAPGPLGDADRVLRLVRLTDHADKLPAQLSDGQRQRTAIAHALTPRPPLVLLDEPLSDLDTPLRLELRAEVRHLHRSLGLTTVYVTHDQEEALALADRLVVLRDGEVEQVGAPEEVYARPRNHHVAAFMGYRNLLPARVTATDGDHATVSLGGVPLTGVTRDDLTSGDAVVAIRPEDFSVALRQTDNVLEAVVEAVEYHGREHAVAARLPDGRPLHVRTAGRPSPGDAVRLRVPVDRALVFAP
ncbi:ABC transporter ATP-binding protein [Saccharothrix sp. HUAS TT1]|uniref:ABC transporter ATP-binding protein n=1 Tax=unclassified Saccharothrix TaxID=2593673 RepID=UPI00345C19FF